MAHPLRVHSHVADVDARGPTHTKFTKRAPYTRGPKILGPYNDGPYMYTLPIDTHVALTHSDHTHINLTHLAHYMSLHSHSGGWPDWPG
jgi:hypothetical protein